MKKTIFKYSLPGSFIEIPDGGEILSIQHQNGVPTMWILVDTTKPLVKREFLMFGTGQEFDTDGLVHIHTIQHDGYVWHIFERVAVKPNENDKTESEILTEIYQLLKEGKQFGLETEVVWAALNAMKENPKLSTIEAMQIGVNEWVK